MNTIPQRHTPPMFFRQWESARDEARDLDKYAPNWDGADADPVSWELIQATLGLFRDLEEMAYPAPDLIYPAADGTVFVEWHYQDSSVYTVNIRWDRLHIVLMGPDGNIVHTPSEATYPNLGSADGDAFEFALAV